MRNFLLLLLLTSTSLYSFSQTTEEEYNYVTKGYKIQLKSGLDMKKGYRFEDIETWQLNYQSFNRSTTFKLLYKINDVKPCAILMKISKSDNKYEAYLCIPHYSSSEEIWNKSYEDFRKAAYDWSENSKAYSWGMMKMISYLTTVK